MLHSYSFQEQMSPLSGEMHPQHNCSF
ncbi:uncharacterized protein METZ01_LOCUS31071 [marine metagenome]|uniref:Uncharacterized protein n=1 Tax=marine metagenome TaxID=408172 RepID=A0A381QJG7_9ZZZZ